MTEQKKNTEEFEIDLVEVIKKLYKNRKLISIITGVFMVFGLIYAFSVTPIYKATLTMYPADGEGSKKGGLMSMASSFGMNVGGSKETYNVEDVIKSRTIAKEVVLHKWKTNKFSEPVSLLEFSGKEIQDTAKAIYYSIESYSDMVNVETNKETGLMTLSIESVDPLLSAEIANYLGVAVTKYVQENQGVKAKRNITHICKRLDEVSKELVKAEENVKDYKLNNRDSYSVQAQLELARLSRVLQIKQGVFLTLSQQKEIAEIEKIKKAPVINILDKAEVPLFKIKPRKSLICVIFTFLGGMMGVLFVLIVPFIKDRFGDFKLAKLVK
ncbi:MAG: Wzz/FepE/Etk N-terminal domain-containing protein [Marinifilaceae bacterium]